jgi:hypothetical protein
MTSMLLIVFVLLQLPGFQIPLQLRQCYTHSVFETRRWYDFMFCLVCLGRARGNIVQLSSPDSAIRGRPVRGKAQKKKLPCEMDVFPFRLFGCHNILV